MIKIKTERLIVRDARESDFQGWHELMSDPSAMYFVDDIMTKSEAESRENLNVAISQAQSGETRNMFFFAIELAATGEFVGSIGYTLAERGGRNTAHAGYFILPRFHNKGYTTEAFAAVMRFAFSEGGVVLLETGCYADNRPSERVMQKCGMKKDMLYAATAWHDGRVKARLRYAVTCGEYFDNESYELMPASRQNVSQWSGGETTELYVYPKGASYAARDFSWRLSSARIEAEYSDFTPLPGISRRIMPLDVPLRLNCGGEAVSLEPFMAHSFDGGVTTTSRGQCRDFNLMLGKGYAGEISVAVREETPEQGMFMALYFLGAASVNIDGVHIAIEKNDLLLIKSAGRVLLNSGAPVIKAWVSPNC